jgi:predicted N-acyltransferase
MEYEIIDTIRDIDEQEWNFLAGDTRVEGSHGWYRTMEDSGMKKLQYVIVRDTTLKAAAVCRLYTDRIYTMEVTLLDVKPFHFATESHVDTLLEGLKKINKMQHAKGLMFLFHEKEPLNTVKKQVKKSTDFQMRENTYIDLDFNDFEDYLSSLNGKVRRSIRITLNKANRLSIQSVFTNEFSHWKEVTHQLQGYFCAQHNDYRQHLPEKFYEALEKNLKDSAELMLFLKEGIPLAFGLALNSPTISQLKIGGADPHYRRYHAYFLIYYEGIRRAIERGQKKIFFGPSTYEFKEKIGCKRKDIYGLVKLENPLLNLALKSYITGLNLFGKKL